MKTTNKPVHPNLQNMKTSSSFRRVLSGSAAALLAITLGSQSAFAVDGTWNKTDNQTYEVAANWLGGVNVADGVGATGTFTISQAGSNRTITVGSNHTLGIWNLGQGGKGLTFSGAGVMTLDNTGSANAQINVANGGQNVSVNTAIELMDSLTIDSALVNGKSLSIGGTITVKSGASNSGNLTITNKSVNGGSPTTGFFGVISDGAGTISFSQITAGFSNLGVANTFSGATTVSAGNLRLDNALSLQNSALDTSASILGDANNGLMINSTGVTALTLGGLTGNKNFAGTGGVFTSKTTNGGYGAITALTLNPGTGKSYSYSGVIANGAANMTLTKTGAGTQTLSGTNTYTGLTLVSAGILNLGHATDTLANSGAVTVSGGTLDIAGNSDTVGAVTLTSGSITGSGGVLSGSSYDVQSGSVSAILGGSGSALTKTTSGSVTLSGANTYTGTSTIRNGTVVVGASGAFGNASSNILLTDASSGASDNVSLLMNGATTSSLTRNITVQNNAASGTTTIGTGPVNGQGLAASTSATFSGGITLAKNVTLVNNFGGANSNVIFSGVIGGTGDIFISANSTNSRQLSFTNATGNTYVGKVWVGSGGLNAGVAAGNAITGDLEISGTGLFTLNSATNFNQVADTSNVIVKNGGTWNSNNFNETIGSLSDGGTTGGSVTLGTGALTIGAASGSTTFAGIVSGTSGSLVKNGASTQTLSGNNSYTGGTTLSGGTLLANHNNALGSGTLTFNSTAVQFKPGDGVTLANAIVIGANTGFGGQGLIQYGGASSATLSGPITINNSAGAGGHFGTSSGGVLNITGVITSSVNVTQRAGTVVYSGGGTGYTFLGITGTGRLGANNGLATTAKVNIGGSAAGTFDLAGFNQSVSGIERTVNTNAAIIGNSSTTADSTLTTTGTSSYNAVIQDVIGSGTRKVAVTVNGGSLTLSGTNTYTGGTLVSAGTLNLSHATDTLANGGAVTVSGGTLAIAGNSDTVGAVSLTSGSITGSGGTLTGSSYAVESGSVSAILGGSGVVLTKSTSGTVTLSGTNTYTGTTTINAGTLQAGAAAGGQAFGNLSAVTLADVAGATLDLNNFNQTVGSLAGGGGTGGSVTLGSGTLTVETASGSTTFAGVISGTSGSLVKNGASTQTLSAANTYSGATTIDAGTLTVTGSLTATTAVNINAGTLLLGASNVINDTATVTLAGGTLNTGGNGETVGALTLSSSSTIDLAGLNSANALHFAASNANTWTGTLSIWNWSGTTLAAGGGNGGTELDQVFFGNSNGDLTAGQLGQITFFSDGGSINLGSAAFGNNGQIVPVPEPTTIFGALALVGLVGYRERRRVFAKQVA